jgi:hypothetical protein
LKYFVVTVFGVAMRRSLLILAAMLLSACGDRKGSPASVDRQGSTVAEHVTAAGEEFGMTGLRDRGGESRATPLLVQWRWRLSRCSVVLRLQRSGFVRALLQR